MPKHKKRKTTHHSNVSANDELTHEQIWDDSALIRSWNDALAEYKYYHSIFVSGEDVEEVLDRAEQEGVEAVLADRFVDTNNIDANNTTQIENDPEPEDGEVDEDRNLMDDSSRHPEGGTVDPATTVDEAGLIAQRKAELSARLGNTAEATARVQSPASASSHSKIEPAPPDTAPDQTLENVKMAYYWAGYYSGLYDGQRQAYGQGQGQAQRGKEH